MASTAESRQATIASANTALVMKIRAIQAKYADKLPTVGELLVDVDGWWRIASEFASTAGTMSGLSSGDLREAEDNALGLLEFRGQLKIQDPNIVVSADVRDIGVNLITAPIAWLLRIRGGVLATAEVYLGMAEKAKNAPSDALGWLLDQLRRSLGLPGWFVPVVAGTAVVGVGAWAYLTFLAPVTRATRIVHQNPQPRRLR